MKVSVEQMEGGWWLVLGLAGGRVMVKPQGLKSAYVRTVERGDAVSNGDFREAWTANGVDYSASAHWEDGACCEGFVFGHRMDGGSPIGFTSAGRKAWEGVVDKACHAVPYRGWVAGEEASRETTKGRALVAMGEAQEAWLEALGKWRDAGGEGFPDSTLGVACGAVDAMMYEDGGRAYAGAWEVLRG